MKKYHCIGLIDEPVTFQSSLRPFLGQPILPFKMLELVLVLTVLAVRSIPENLIDGRTSLKESRGVW
jgi:hypothetical protein